MLTPTQAFYQLLDLYPTAILLEFSPRNEKPYAFIGFNPLAQIIARGDEITVFLKNTVTKMKGDPFHHLRRLRQQINCIDNHPLTKLTGAAIGYLSYDAIRYVESIPDRHTASEKIADIDFKFYRDGITFDLESNNAIVSHVVEVKDELKHCYEYGLEKLADITNNLFTPARPKLSTNRKTHYSKSTSLDFKPDSNDTDFKKIVNKAKQYIAAGDIFQVVSSRTFKKPYQGKPFDIYRALKKVSPSPYHFYLQNDSLAIAGASPEKMVSVKNGIIDSVPLAGTRPRGNGKSDQTLAQELINDPKETAEHLMLVDLARNDIGIVSQAGSVEVAELMQPVNFSHVMHLASRVQGSLAKNYDAIDVLKATFPAGTLSGAPKIRAMEIIDELEHSRRGLYGGAIVALDRDDNLDTCIIIRTTIVENGIASIRAGAGIVHDSDPIAEANETRHKAKSVMAAIQLAEGGL
ncbi:anthranilate synthase component I family protein [Coxiella burnetii]|uniref:anthranilate synthase component I family protein n=1 Tax=Coxiella burnetii TaxID=777 RepID=UPI00223234A1|nr:anthranilate synthase component I family protein [Coxiella burnetii]